jgi:hypothetical protein
LDWRIGSVRRGRERGVVSDTFNQY